MAAPSEGRGGSAAVHAISPIDTNGAQRSVESTTAGAPKTKNMLSPIRFPTNLASPRKVQIMRKLLTLIAAPILIGTAAIATAAPVDREAELSRALEGRQAGEPVDCIDLQRVRNSRVIADTAIIYDAGSTLYVNRPRAGAESLDRWDTLLTRLHSSRLCSIDTVQLVDPQSRMTSGVVFLGEFVPYRRVRTD